MTQNMIDLLRWLVDSLVILWFFLPMEGPRGRDRVLRVAGLLLCLLATVALYPAGWMMLGIEVRSLYRGVVYALCIRLSKQLRGAVD